MRRGILGGTFDPIHTGHLILAQEVQWRLGLDEVWFMPTGEPWMKRGEPLTGKNHRKAMVELAIAENATFRLSTAELDRPGDTYTVDTLELLRSDELKDDDVMFIMGVDTFNSLHRWKDPARILELVRLVVALRPGYGTIDLTELESIYPTVGERVMTVEMPLIEISGTELRRRAADGEPIHYLVPDVVREYIEGNGLYR
ncbi:MAG: nicotinate-nucleotide adenylyltransferase [Chloroflexi bacterium]|nr:nicotinate-nucleotide adenylyltransferase [Chloroflexota bacterium]